MLRLGATITACLLSAGCVVNPVPLDHQELVQIADAYRTKVAANQEPVTGPIGLYEAMARALKYNLDKRVEAMETALRTQELRLASYDQLPQIVANSGYDGRSNFSGGTSISLLTGVPSLEPSTSSEKNVLTADFDLSWDILDFGISYIRAKQTADEILIAEELKRKVVNRIIEDVRTAYWRAVSAQRLAGKLRQLQGDVERELAASREIVRQQDSSPLTALTFQRELVQIKREIQGLERELRLAKFQLAALMNLPPDQTYRIAMPRRRNVSPMLRSGSLQGMIQLALENRPELREVGYRRRINAQEAQIAALELLPNVKGFADFNLDSNNLLFNNDWVGWGAAASWSLLKVFSYPQRRRTVEAQDNLLEQRALALTMAIITQVNVSRARYHFLRRELATASDYYAIQRKILDQIRAGAKADTISQQTLIREEMNTLVAEVKYDIAYAELQNAYANVFTSIGLDPFGPNITGEESVAELSQSMVSLWASRGDALARATNKNAGRSVAIRAAKAAEKNTN